MGQTETNNAHGITTDAELQAYLKETLRSTHADPDFPVIKNYLATRDFDVEPLAPPTACELLHIFTEDVSAKQETDTTITAWIPATDGDLETVTDTITSLGYEVDSLTRTNRTTAGTPVIELTATQSPDRVAQLHAVADVTQSPIDALYAYLIAIHATDDNITTINDIVNTWHHLFNSDTETLKSQFNTVSEQVSSENGIPGTEWAMDTSSPSTEFTN